MAIETESRTGGTVAHTTVTASVVAREVTGGAGPPAAMLRPCHAFLGLLLAFGYPLVNGLTDLAHRLPSYVQDAEHGRGWIGHLVRRFHLAAWAQRNAPKLESLGAGLAKPALTFGKARRQQWRGWQLLRRLSCCCCLRARRCAEGCWA